MIVQSVSHLLLTDINFYLQTMPKLSRTLTIKLFLLLRILPVVETIALSMFLIGGVAFILLGLCALICISTTKVQQRTLSKIVKKPTAFNSNINKTEYLAPDKSAEANKEMDMYYCSLLSPSSDGDDSQTWKAVPVRLNLNADWIFILMLNAEYYCDYMFVGRRHRTT